MSDGAVKIETIQAVDRAFQILETIGRVNSMSLAELNKEIKVNKASLSRLVYTLVQNGYLAKNEKNGDYSLTLKTYEVGLNAVQNLDKLSLIKSTLVDLNNRSGRIAQFSVEDNNQLLCLQSIGKEAMSFSVYTSVGHYIMDRAVPSAAFHRECWQSSLVHLFQRGNNRKVGKDEYPATDGKHTDGPADVPSGYRSDPPAGICPG